MICKYCKQPCQLVPVPWEAPNRMSGIDYLSACCCEPIVDETTGEQIPQERLKRLYEEDQRELSLMENNPYE